MKLLSLAFLALFSSALFADECSLSSGPAQSHIEFLRQGETTNWFGKEYVCVEEARKASTEVIRISADTCEIIKGEGQNVMIYCLAY